MKRDGKVVQTLDDVAVEPIGMGHQLEDAGHLDPFQNQPPCHDQPDVP